MEITDNEAGGTTVMLTGDDDLSLVPASHAALLTEYVRDVFADPGRMLSDAAAHAPVPAMKTWFETAMAEADWQLNLEIGRPSEWRDVRLYLWPESVYPLAISLTEPTPAPVPTAPDIISDCYRLVGPIRWMPFGLGGGLDHPPFYDMTACGLEGYTTEVRADEAFAFGRDLCGHAVFYTLDDRGGWMSHSGEVRLLGNVADTLQWLYTELLHQRSPTMYDDSP